METTRAERIRLGIFLLLCIVGILGFAGYLIGEKVREQKISYFAVFSESVQGLSLDARVMLNGIDVGRVTKTQIDPMNLEKVVVWFEVNPETPVKRGTTVQMTSGISLTGNRYLILSGGEAMEQNLPDGSQVRVGKNRINEITGQAESMIERVEILINNLNNILSSENAGKISRTLSNLESASAGGKKLVENGNALVVNSNALVNNSNRMVENGSLLIGDGRVLLKSLETPIQNLDSITQSFKTVSNEMKDAHLVEELKKTLDDVQAKLAALDTKQMNDDLVKTLHSVQEMSKRIDLFVYKNQNAVSEVINQMNEIMDNLNEFSQKVKNNPSSLIRGAGDNGRD
ncbi:MULTISPECIES: MlaD family protein [unclassified Fibrobacter]|uniref:MlaD family protein n=1 Tax=unclassified Fibrobacter TaxID=2634177 RepID=UPI000D6B3F80|nr:MULTISPECIES: MlaD family protein [unclassified Fibrobacter]PWJ64913.1 phospholipid/cholesterol/gamma-HCH transport system substrate-binding protein [Fibrobacter sp. UWR4]PZW68978.1 phospholipid/cholesterol/gamma-HCH transport system substrate-binding protein [Fibrobacter sp. UWR1]